MQINRALVLAVLSLISTASGAAADGGDPTVVGGRPVAAGDWPDAVAVLGAEGRCSGTLIAPDVVLTAGHCIDTRPWTIVANATDLDAHDGEWIRVVRSIAYPGWEDSYDVGVLVLEHPARTPPRAVARACTARAELRRGAEVTVVGFGMVTEDATDANRQKHVAAIGVRDARCTTDAACLDALTGAEFIAGGGGVDACFGDSGGGAYVETDAGWAVMGVVSRGLAGDWRCGNGGIYVRTDRVAAWIEEVTGKRIARAACDGGADDPGDADADDTGGGCSAGGAATGGASGALAVLVVGLVTLRRRRA